MDTALQETALRRTRSGNLTAALVAFAVLELFVNRVFSRLFAPGATLASGSGGSHGPRLMDGAGPLLFNLTAVLALGLFVTAFSGLIRRQELYPRAVRYAVAVIALFFAVFAGRALVRGQLPSRHFLFLEIGFAFLVALTVLSLARAATPWRAKLGVTLFALPGVLRAFAIVGSAGGPGVGGAQGAALASAGELALVVASIAAPLLLPARPLRERRWRLALGVAAGATAAFVAALAKRFDLVQASVLYGLRIDLPHPGSFAGVAHVAAFFAWVYATTQLLGEKGGMRLAGYGLLLLALGGYETGSPVELSLSLLGVVALAVGELRAAPATGGGRPSVSAPEWRAFVGRLSSAASDASGPEDIHPEAVVVSDGDIEMSRIHTYRRGYPVSIKLRRRRGRLIEMDATLGTTGHNLPDASIERHRRWLARSPEHRLKLARLKTGDPTFDQKFSVHGDAPLADDELRHRVARQQGDGVLTIWRGGAARYQLAHPTSDADAPAVFAGTVEGTAPVASIVELLDTLADLVEATLPAAS